MALRFSNDLFMENGGDPPASGGKKGTEQRRTTGQRERAANPATKVEGSESGDGREPRCQGQCVSAEEGGPRATSGGTTKAKSRGRRAEQAAGLTARNRPTGGGSGGTRSGKPGSRADQDPDQGICTAI
ncbi:hypothetical protein ES703_16766 [subsurface metagenome]